MDKIIGLFFFLQQRNAREGNPACIFILAVSVKAFSGYLEDPSLLTLCMAPSKIETLRSKTRPNLITTTDQRTYIVTTEGV